MRSGRCSSLRKGVTIRVVTTSRMVQSPVKCVMYSRGLAVRSPFHVRQASHNAGARPARNTRTLTHRRFNIVRLSEILLQIHAGIEAGHLVAVAVEHLRGMIL